MSSIVAERSRSSRTRNPLNPLPHIDWRDEAVLGGQITLAWVALTWLLTVVWSQTINDVRYIMPLRIPDRPEFSTQFLDAIAGFLDSIPAASWVFQVLTILLLGFSFVLFLLYALGQAGKQALKPDFRLWQRVLIVAALPATIFVLTPWFLMAFCSCYGIGDTITAFDDTSMLIRTLVASGMMLAMLLAGQMLIKRPVEQALQDKQVEAEKTAAQSRLLLKLAHQNEDSLQKDYDGACALLIEDDKKLKDKDIELADMRSLKRRNRELEEQLKQEKEDHNEQITDLKAELATRPPAAIVDEDEQPARLNLAEQEARIKPNSNKRRALDILRSHGMDVSVLTEVLSREMADALAAAGLQPISQPRAPFHDLRIMGLVDYDADKGFRAVPVLGVWPKDGS